MAEEQREQLERYRDEVLQEIERRVSRLREIDSQIAAAEFQLDGLSAARGPRVGNTGRMLAQTALREKIKRDRAKLEASRAEAVDDVRSAQSRLEQVDAELRELESADGVRNEFGEQEGE